MSTNYTNIQFTQPERGNSGELFDKKDIQAYFTMVLDAYKGFFQYDLKYMKLIVTDQPSVYSNGTPATDTHPVESCGGSHTKLNFITFNINYKSVMKFYKLPMEPARNMEEDFILTILAHELGHEVYQKHLSPRMKNTLIEEIRRTKFSTVYTQAVRENMMKGKISKEKYEEELIAEYLAAAVIKVIHTEESGYENLSKICQDISLQQHQIAQMSYAGYEDLNSIKRLFRNAANNVYRILQNVRSTIWNGFKDLKRSELQSYVDHNKFTVSHILDTNYAILVNTDVYIPFKMSSTYYQAVTAVENTLLLLDMENRINTELNMAKAIVSQLMAKSTELSLGTNTISSYELEKLQTSFTKQDACFRSPSRVTKKRFDQVYRRPSSFKDTYTKLSKLTQYEYGVAKVYKCLENIYKQYDIMVNFLEKENPDIDKSSLARVHQHTYTIAKLFDMYGTTMMNVLRLEHNFVLTLEEIRKTQKL